MPKSKKRYLRISAFLKIKYHLVILIICFICLIPFLIFLDDTSIINTNISYLYQLFEFCIFVLWAYMVFLVTVLFYEIQFVGFFNRLNKEVKVILENKETPPQIFNFRKKDVWSLQNFNQMVQAHYMILKNFKKFYSEQKEKILKAFHSNRIPELEKISREMKEWLAKERPN